MRKGGLALPGEHDCSEQVQPVVPNERLVITLSAASVAMCSRLMRLLLPGRGDPPRPRLSHINPGICPPVCRVPGRASHTPC